MKLFPVILSGGVGPRLWPVSREVHPKPFMKLPDGQSVLQKSVAHAVSLSTSCESLTITKRDLFFKTASPADLVLIEVKSGNYFGEDDIVRFGDEYGRA